MNDENVPIDAVALRAQEIVQAALVWRSRMANRIGYGEMNKAEWELAKACNDYGDKYRGLRSA